MRSTGRPPHGKVGTLSIGSRRNPKVMVPDLVDWFEEPFPTLWPIEVGAGKK